MRHGRVLWCPRIILEEIEQIKQLEGISSDGEAFVVLGSNARIGRQVKTLQVGNNGKKRRRLEDFFGGFDIGI